MPPRYRDDSAYAGIVFRTLGRPLPGAELGIEDAQTIGRVMQLDFALEHTRAASVDALAATVRSWAQQRGIHFVLANLPAAELLELAGRVARSPVLLFNVSAADDALRGTECRRNVAHAYPSAGMLTDALVQYLVAKRWRDVLVLHGPAAADALTVAALRRSAAKFGVTILLQHRFERLAAPRRMNDEASAAWIAVKAVTQAVLRTSTTDFAALRGFILDDAINLDGSKGNRMSFRAWDQQLRQPILLATADAVIARARRCRTSCTDERPRHLGQDAAESACRF